METVLLILAFVLLCAGVFGVFFPLLPGPPLGFVGLLALQWSGRGGFSLAFLLIMGLVTILVTVMDYLLPSLLAKRFGGSRAASIGSFAGLLAGLFLFPPWGFIIGPFLGAMAGELIYRRGGRRQAVKVAFGAFAAFVVGSGIKLLVCAFMLFFAIRAVTG